MSRKPRVAVWRFSDGTVVHLGGTVEGESPFAEDLRAELAGSEPIVVWGRCTMPGRGNPRPLDLQDSALVDEWLDARSEPYRRSFGMTARRPQRLPRDSLAWRLYEGVMDAPAPLYATPEQTARVEAYRARGGKL